MVCHCCATCADSTECQKWCKVVVSCIDPGTGAPGQLPCVITDGEMGCIKYFLVNGGCAGGACTDPTSAVYQEIQAFVNEVQGICDATVTYSTLCTGFCCSEKCRRFPCCADQMGCEWEYAGGVWTLIGNTCDMVYCDCFDPPVGEGEPYEVRVLACQQMSGVMALSLGGAGTELKSLLGWFGMKPTKGCKCERRARLMDSRGCDWCEANLAEIVSWLQEEHERQKILIPFVPKAAESLVKLAIRRARKKGTCK